MPLYDFRNLDTGETIEEFFSMQDVPPMVLRQKPEGGTETFVRVYTVPEARVKADRHFISHQLPRNYKHHNRFDAKGNCAFTSQREVDECMARANDSGEGLSYDY